VQLVPVGTHVDPLVGVHESHIDHTAVHAVPSNSPRVGLHVVDVLLGIEDGDPTDAGALVKGDQRRAVLIARSARGVDDRALADVGVVRRLPDPSERDPLRDVERALDEIGPRGHEDDASAGRGRVERFLKRGCVIDEAVGPCSVVHHVLGDGRNGVGHGRADC